MSLPTKRSGTAGSSPSPPPPMKKAKSLLLRAPSDDAVLDSSPMPLDDDLPNARAANLSRKKATPPQPAKKLLIKLHKGPIHSTSFLTLPPSYLEGFSLSPIPQ